MDYYWKIVQEGVNYRAVFCKGVKSTKENKLFYTTICETPDAAKALVLEIGKSIKANAGIYRKAEKLNGFTFSFSCNGKEYGESHLFVTSKSCESARKEFVTNADVRVIRIAYDEDASCGVIPVDPAILNYMMSLDGVGFDQENHPILSINNASKPQWENRDNYFWSNEKLRKNFFEPVCLLEEES